MNVLVLNLLFLSLNSNSSEGCFGQDTRPDGLWFTNHAHHSGHMFFQIQKGTHQCETHCDLGVV